ncbi:MAG: zinc ribbon domain-containing protein [Hormoscilla sp. GUM202]|nr:zinc ribbon domain-containing protein [Hormoscilla sp. GUM202]
MPIYVYHCPDNQQTLEVLHSMHQTIATWAEWTAGCPRTRTCPQFGGDGVETVGIGIPGVGTLVAIAPLWLS